MSKYLDRWMSKISGPVEDDVPDDLMALVLELDRRLAAGPVEAIESPRAEPAELRNPLH